jgi:dihydropyrimidinase
MSLLIRNGRIIMPDTDCIADLLCENGVVSRIGRGLEAPPGANIVDATGKYVFPGFIDPHVHIYLPFMGTFSKDTWESASRAAIVGGTTTLIEMCCPARKDNALEAFELWLSKAEGNSSCDFSFHMGVSRFDSETESNLREITRRGISSYKIFLAYKGAFGIDDTELYRVLSLARELGVIVTAHCENETLVAERSRELLAAGKTDPGQHHESRPPLVEAEGVHHLMSFAELTGAATYIVHLSCREALDKALDARRRGVRVGIETLIQYLTLDKTYAERGGFEGAKYVMSPPLRDVANQDILWRGLRDGLVNTVATDHAPFDFATQKSMGKDDFTKIPNGIPSLEERVNLLYTHGVAKGRLDLQRFVDVASTQAAKYFGLFPKKGTLQPGSDADIVVFDPSYRGIISAKTHHMAVDYSAFEGWPVEGRPSLVTVRGEVMAKDGVFVGKKGHGRFLQRQASHF